MEINLWRDIQSAVTNTEFMLTDYFGEEEMIDLIVPVGVTAEVLWCEVDTYFKSGYALLVRFIDTGISELDGHVFVIDSGLFDEE